MHETNAMPGKNFRFPTPSPPHIAYIKDRPRNSGLTSLRFTTGNRFVCCDFNEKTMYLAQYDGVKVDIVATTRTVIADGTPVQTDLLDANAEGLLVTSNFYQGTQSFFQLKGDSLAFVAEMKLNDFIRCHGVRFVPGYDDLLWITYCGKDNKAVVIADYRRQKVLHMLKMPEQMQDTAFIGPYAIAPARTNHIKVDGPYSGEMYATVYLFAMPADLRRDPPRLIDVWRGEGHLDAMKEYDGQAYSANQYTDAIDVFGVGANECIEYRRALKGFWMPHGVDVRADGLLGATNYGDNSLRFVPLRAVQPAA